MIGLLSTKISFSFTVIFMYWNLDNYEYFKDIHFYSDSSEITVFNILVAALYIIFLNTQQLLVKCML